ncbi:TIGR02391 family protein [Chloroflexota bacterium]
MADIEEVVKSARHLQQEIDRLGIGQPIPPQATTPKPEEYIELYDILIKSDELREVTRKLFSDGHYARAVEEAYKCINNTVKDKSQLPKDGHDLMNEAFSIKNPVLKLNDLKTDSQRNEQVGYMNIFGGCMTGVRNPRAHEHRKKDSPEGALEMLAWANHLMRVVHKAKRVRKSKKALAP